MNLIYEKRKESKDMSELPIAKLAEIIGVKRINSNYAMDMMFGEEAESQETKLTSKEIKEIDRDEELRFLSLFDLEAYEANASNYSKLIDEEFDELSPSSKSAHGSYTQMGVFHPELFLNKKCIETILWAVENDFWAKIKEESSL